MSTKLTPAQLHAVALVAKDASKVRDKLTPGEYSVDFGVQITGTLKVGDVQGFTSSAKPDAIDVIAALLMSFGPKKRFTIAESITAELLDAVDDESRTAAKDIFTRLATPISGERRGSVAGKLDVAIID